MNQPPPHDPATIAAEIAFTAEVASAREKRLRDHPLPPRADGTAAHPTQDHEESA